MGWGGVFFILVWLGFLINILKRAFVRLFKNLFLRYFLEAICELFSLLIEFLENLFEIEFYYALSNKRSYGSVYTLKLSRKSVHEFF